MPSLPTHGAAPRLHFADFTLVPARRELLRAGRPVAIGERAFLLLLALAERAGDLVTKQELMTAAWGGRHVEESNLTVQMAGLRRILRGDGASDGHCALIQTVQGRGYILATTVSQACDRPAPAMSPADGPVPGGSPAGDRDHAHVLPSIPDPAEPATLFIGRESERAAIVALLARSRNVCVVGIGGVGKTRLVLRLRQELAPPYPQGVLFVDLAPLSDPGQVKETLAAALGAGSGTGSAEAAILGQLRSAHQLLILDNAEHLLPATRQLVSAVLAACPRISILVTSRESLGIPGETVFRLLPLAVPPDREISASDAAGYDAIGLFADRARSLIPTFELDDENVVHVARICRQLDGIALAIEMAVPRLEVLTLRQLSERLHDRFGALAAPRHPVPSRQRTLRAMFDWSWELLSAPERELLQLVAVFVGGATLAMLEALAPVTGSAGPDVVDLLAALAQKSLLVVSLSRSAQQEPRYGVLETTRQYALDRTDPLAASRLHRDVASCLADRFERADAEWPTTHSTVWLSRYGPDADNLRAAMHWAFNAPGETELALRLVTHSSLLWWELPGLPLRESRHWHLLATSRIGPRTPRHVEARLWLGLSWTDTIDGDVENYPLARRAVDLFRAAGDPNGLGASLWRAASTVMFRHGHDPAAADLLSEAEHVLDGQAVSKWHALCRVRRADLLQAEAPEEALAEYDRALSMMQAGGYQYGRMVCGGNRAYLLFDLGRRDEAIDGLQDLRRALPIGLSWPVVSQLSMLLMADERVRPTLEVTFDSLISTLGTGMVATLARTLEALALALARREQVEAAAVIFGYVLKQHPAARVRLGPRRLVFARLNATLEARLSPVVQARLMARGNVFEATDVAEMAMDLSRKALGL